MHVLIVVDHPIPDSLTHGVANVIPEGVREAEGHSVEIANLAAECFDPRFAPPDVEAYHSRAALPADVLAEQARVDRADALVLVFPIYWWSMPALLKGWIDRVFVNGWAFEIDGDKEKGKLGRLTVHLVGIGGSGPGTYARRGYADAMRTSIESGIFGYCGARVAGFHLLLDSELDDQTGNLARAREIGRSLRSIP